MTATSPSVVTAINGPNGEAGSGGEASEDRRDPARKKDQERDEEEAEESRGDVGSGEPQRDDRCHHTRAEDEARVASYEERARADEQREGDNDRERSKTRVNERLVDPPQRRPQGLIDRRGDDPCDGDGAAVVLPRALQEVVDVGAVPGDDRDERQGEPDGRPAAKVSASSAERAPMAANAIPKCGSVQVPTTPALQKATIVQIRGERSASSAATVKTPIARKASPYPRAWRVMSRSSGEAVAKNRKSKPDSAPSRM